MLPRIFERYYRAGASRASKEGTGLGLAIVKAVADAHGARVTAVSDVVEGTQMRFSIPLAQPLSANHQRDQSRV
jgi:signal transduction histidine kinase